MSSMHGSTTSDSQRPRPGFVSDVWGPSTSFSVTPERAPPSTLVNGLVSEVGVGLKLILSDLTQREIPCVWVSKIEAAD